MKKARKLSSFPSRILVVTCLVFAFAGRSGAYDVPDFQHGLFDPDGLFLEGNLRDSLLEALAAVASNYPGNPRVDEDLCEKALAIALRIDPLHFHSRAAHEAHARGREPKPTSFFSEPAGVVELLWKNGLEFSAPDSEPERRRLGPHLMEISLLLHPELPRERIVTFLRLAGGDLSWGDAVVTQPENPSIARAAHLADLAANRAMGRPNGGPGAQGSESRTDERARNAKAVPGRVEVPFVAPLLSRNDAAAAGVARLLIRDPEPVEEELFALRSPDDDPSWANQMQIEPDVEGIPPAGLGIVRSIVRDLHPVWPMRKIGEVAFLTGVELETPRALLQADLSLAGTLLAHAALDGRPIASRVAFAGGLPEGATTSDVFVTGGDNAADLVAAGAACEERFLVLAQDAETTLSQWVIETDGLDSLIDPQLLSVTTLNDLFLFAFEEDRAKRDEAGDAFDEITAVATSGRMSLPELARNEKVRERLEAIVAAYPRHLSSRIMLAYGERRANGTEN